MTPYSNNVSFYDIAPLLELEAARYSLCFSVRAKVEMYELAPLIRSRFGAILKDSFCEFQDYARRDCDRCELSPGCLYIRLFAPTCESVEKDFQGRGRCHTDPPRPYTLAAQGSADKATLVLTLFGREAAEHYETMTASLTEAAQSLKIRHLYPSKDNGSERLLENLSLYAFLPVKKGGKYCFEKADDERLMQEALLFPLSEWISALPEPCAIGGENWGENQDAPDLNLLELNFPVPFQIERMRGSFNFTVFLQSVVSRLRDLKRIYHPDNDMGSFSKQFYAKADRVRAYSHLSYREYSWYSQHRKKKIFLDGYSGSVMLKGALEPFLTVLAAAFYTGIGKKTVYGLGYFDSAPWGDF